MRTSRREFLVAGLRVGAIALLPALPSWKALAQSPASRLPRMKLEEFVSSPDRLASLKRGVAVMKARKPSDPTSWFFQGAIHSVTDEAIAEATAIDPNVANVDHARFWRQCPHGLGFHSADFLIWHRAYIFHFERILRAASGDSTLSLPYWNYTALEQRQFPAAFADDDADPATQLPRNPLYDHRREQAFAFGLYELSENVVTTSAIYEEQVFFGEDESSGLAGGVADDNPRSRGRLERQPHDLLHFAIGGSIGVGPVEDGTSADGLMSQVQTAAFDPIFWVHHANIDRLWTVWDCLNTPVRKWGKVPDKDWLEKRPWSFHDETGAIHNESRLHYLDRRNLAVSYDSDAPQCQPLSATDPRKEISATQGLGLFALSASIKSFKFKADAGANTTSARVGPDEPFSQSIDLQLPVELRTHSLKSLVLSSKPKKPRRIVLDLEGLKLEGVTSAGYDVYANVSEGISPDRSMPNYLGTIALFGALDGDHSDDHAHSQSTQRFDLTHLAAQNGFNEQKLTVSIVPFDLLTPRAGQPRLRRDVGISYQAIRVVVVEGSSLLPQ